MILTNYSSHGQPPTNSDCLQTQRLCDEVANFKSRESPDSQSVRLSLASISTSPLIHARPLILPVDQAGVCLDRLFPSVSNLRNTSMSVLDLRRCCLFHLPQLTGSESSPFISKGTIHKVNFKHLRSGLKISNVEISTADDNYPMTAITPLDKISFRLNSLNSISLSGKPTNSTPMKISQPPLCQSKVISLESPIKSVPIGHKSAVTKKLKLPPKKRVTISCNCKNSKCTKLYCDCFRAQGFCSHRCSCINCGNNSKQSPSHKKNPQKEIHETKNPPTKNKKPARKKVITKLSRQSNFDKYQKNNRDGRECVARIDYPEKLHSIRNSRKRISNENLLVLNSKGS
jgi:hypothetical protein